MQRMSELDLSKGRKFLSEMNGPGWPVTRMAFDGWLSRNGRALIEAAEESAKLREDVRLASGELLVDMDDAPPGSLVSRLMIANRIMSRERDAALADRDSAEAAQARLNAIRVDLEAEIEELKTKVTEWMATEKRTQALHQALKEKIKRLHD